MATVQPGIDDLRSDLKRFVATVQINSAEQLNRMTASAKDDLRLKMTSIFDRPTPWAINSLYTSKATDTNLSGAVWLKDDRGISAPNVGVPAAKFLWAEIYGGLRQPKGVEIALRSMGILLANQFVTPAREWPRDAYGNIRGTDVQQMLTSLRGGTTKKEYFVMLDPSSGQHIGIARRKGRNDVQMMYMITNSAPQYQLRYPFRNIGIQAAKDEFSKSAGQAVDDALRELA